MKKIVYCIITSIFSLTFLHAEEPLRTPANIEVSDTDIAEDESVVLSSFQFLFDKNFTPYAGGENLLSVHRSLERLNAHSSLAEREGMLSGVARAGELILAWMPMNYVTMVVQHEVFGHGYRIRDLGKGSAEVKRYTFGLPPPYGHGGGATHFMYTQRPSPAQVAAISIGGVEATGILAHTLRLDWFKTGRLPAQEALLYLFADKDLSLYIASMSPDDIYGHHNEGHDIETFLKALNISYYSQGFLTKSKLKSMSKIGYLDPFTYLAVYSWFHYIFSGRQTAIPMFSLGPVFYLPSARLGLTPFGPEYIMDNYLKIKEVPTYVYLKRGHFAKNTYWGAGVLHEALFTRGAHALGICLNVWQQPTLLSLEKWDEGVVKGRAAVLHHKRMGGSSALIYNYSLFPERLSTHIEVGYKTIGFLPGESLRGGLLAKLALNAQF